MLSDVVHTRAGKLLGNGYSQTDIESAFLSSMCVVRQVTAVVHPLLKHCAKTRSISSQAMYFPN
jgi:hypothetical protein